MPSNKAQTLLLAAVLLMSAPSALAQTSYSHFEGRHMHSIGLTPDGTRLLAVNTPDARLSVFDVSNTANPAPILIAEIPVGLEPVSLRARTNDEVWVVSELGDSVAIISLAQLAVVDTIKAADEPADVAFAGGKAFVSCARSNQVRVYDAVTHAAVTIIGIQGNNPRALAVSTDGSKVFTACQLSGNATTTLTATEAPNPPAPTNAALPAAPKTALIVPATDLRIHYTVLDNDVAEINAASLTVTRYFSGVGTNLFDVAVHPSTGELFVPNTEARNLVRFEPNLRGHALDNRVSKISPATSAVTVWDLNPGLDYNALPNSTAQSQALAQPTALAFQADGQAAWVAAFASDRVAKLNTSTGAILTRVDVRTPPPSGTNDSRKMRGPRALAILENQEKLYVLNKLSNTISVIGTATGAVLAEIPTGSLDPMPTSIKEGRGFLFDARLSGNGTFSCGSCHLDADRDGIAWDLGDPGGEMLTVIGYNNSIHDTVPKNRVLHPMKGPLTTQTLRGFQAGQIFHWRGDKPTLQSFNLTFDKLMGASQIPVADMDALAAYLNSLIHHPNPNRNLDRTLPTSVAGGNPTTGRNYYNSHNDSHCSVCHVLPSGSDHNIDLMTEVGSTQPVKTPPLRTVYQRSQFSRDPGAVNTSGFGLLKDGTGYDLPIAHFYVLENLPNVQAYADVEAFVLCFDTGTAPTVGYGVTVTAANAASALTAADLATLEAQARLTGASVACDLVVRGRLSGVFRSFAYVQTTQRYRSDLPSEPERTRAELLGLLSGGDSLTFGGVLSGQGSRLGGDRNADGTADYGSPLPSLMVQSVGSVVRLSWPAADTGWVLEASPNLSGTWTAVTEPRSEIDGQTAVDVAPGDAHRYFRLRRTW